MPRFDPFEVAQGDLVLHDYTLIAFININGSLPLREFRIAVSSPTGEQRLATTEAFQHREARARLVYSGKVAWRPNSAQGIHRIVHCTLEQARWITQAHPELFFVPDLLSTEQGVQLDANYQRRD